jgi:hypothetical protein
MWNKIIGWIEDNQLTVILTVLCILFVASVSLLVWMGVATDIYNGKLIVKSWERTSSIYEFRWVDDYSTSSYNYPDAPAGSRNITHKFWVETIYHSAQYGSRYISKGNYQRYMISPSYTTYENHYRTYYEIQRWVPDYVLTSNGINNDPYYPVVSLDELHRIEGQSENYKFRFFNEKKTNKIYDSSTRDFNIYTNTLLTDDILLTVNKYGLLVKFLPVREDSIKNLESK